MTTTATDLELVQVIRQDHDRIRDLFEQVESARGVQKGDLQRELVRALIVHEAAEREIVHPLTKRAEGGRGIAARRLEEETFARKRLVDLEELPLDAPDLDEHFSVIREAVELHAAAEEEEEHPLLAEVIDEDAGRRFARLFRVAESVNPTHPHPHVPASAVGTLTVGPVMALFDRVRDAVDRARSD